MSRGRLIFPMKVRIARLDLTGTAAPAAPLASGYDPVFRETRVAPAANAVAGPEARVELAPIILKAQVEDQSWEEYLASRTGDLDVEEVRLVFHFKELEDRGLVDATTGDALVPRKGDRLDAILDPRTEAIVQVVPNPPGLFCVHAQPRSYGLRSLRRNLLVVTFRSRMQGSPKA
jgi:hypothetical protein